MAGIVLFQVQVDKPEEVSGPFVEFENCKNILNFSTSGFVKEGLVVSATCYLKLILDLEDFHTVNVAGSLLRPKTKAKFFFNYSDAWIPLRLFMVSNVKSETRLSLEDYFLVYFEADWALPDGIKGNFAYSSPLGLLGVNLYLNQVSECEEGIELGRLTKLVKFPHFPGTEGSFYNGRILLRSKLRGYCLAYLLPKL